MDRYNIYLDDERKCPEDHILCKNYYEFVELITERGLPYRIAFDHDLGSGQPDGRDAAEWLVNYCLERKLELPRCGVHSMNPVGASEIKSVLRTYYEFCKDGGLK